MSERILLAVDLSYQTYRAAAAHPNLSSRRVFTGGLYGFFMTLGKMVRETRATHVAFCRDMKPYLRTRLYPEYKLIRKKAANEELKALQLESMDLILGVFEDCGLSTWGLPGFESDDLIAHCVMKYRHRFSKIYAASNDSDLYQLLWVPNFAIYKDDLKNVMTGARLWEEMQVRPADYMLATALAGTHNDVEGIPRVGVTTALKILRDPAKKRATWAAHGTMIERNLELIQLPHAEFPHEARIPEHGGTFDPRRLYRSLGQYDIDVTPSMVDAFEQLLPRRAR